MNDNELNNMLSDFFSKANLAPGKSTDTLEPTDATRPDEKTIALVFAAHAFVRDAKKIMDEQNENKTDLDLEKLYYLLNLAKQTLDFSLPGLRPFLPR
ncbi:MAG: hypothetical protein Q7U53_17525 [Anaerolineaceae bacterium]|nr:hypothetical protein [Anaerolineaceae bacterium]